MQDGVVIEYDEEIDRKSFIEECKKNKCFDAYGFNTKEEAKSIIIKQFKSLVEKNYKLFSKLNEVVS